MVCTYALLVIYILYGITRRLFDSNGYQWWYVVLGLCSAVIIFVILYNLYLNNKTKYEDYNKLNKYMLGTLITGILSVVINLLSANIF